MKNTVKDSNFGKTSRQNTHVTLGNRITFDHENRKQEFILVIVNDVKSSLENFNTLQL